MRKSKYLILESIFCNFSYDLDNIDLKKSCNAINTLDLTRFDDSHYLNRNDNLIQSLNFVYLPKNIIYMDAGFGNAHIIYIKFPSNLIKIDEYSFIDNEIKYLDLSKCSKLKNIPYQCFYSNPIKKIKLPKYLENIEGECFFENEIEILDLSNCTKLKKILGDAFHSNKIKNIKLSPSIENIEDCSFDDNKIESLDLSICNKITTIYENSFSNNNISDLKLPINVKNIEYSAFNYNQIEFLNLSNCKKLKYINYYAFSDNPLKEIKILDNIKIEYDYSKYDSWNEFAKYYNDNNRKSGDYKLENDEWQWYPL